MDEIKKRLNSSMDTMRVMGVGMVADRAVSMAITVIIIETGLGENIGEKEYASLYLYLSFYRYRRY